MENKHVELYSEEINPDTREVIDEFTHNFGELGFESFVVIGVNNDDKMFAVHYSGGIMDITGMLGLTLGVFCQESNIPRGAIFGALEEMERDPND